MDLPPLYFAMELCSKVAEHSGDAGINYGSYGVCMQHARTLLQPQVVAAKQQAQSQGTNGSIGTKSVLVPKPQLIGAVSTAVAAMAIADAALNWESYAAHGHARKALANATKLLNEVIADT